MPVSLPGMTNLWQQVISFNSENTDQTSNNITNNQLSKLYDLSVHNNNLVYKNKAPTGE